MTNENFSKITNFAMQQTVQLSNFLSILLFVSVFILFAFLLGESQTSDVYFGLVIAMFFLFGAGLMTGSHMYGHYELYKSPYLRKKDIIIIFLIEGIVIILCFLAAIYFGIFADEQLNSGEKANVLFNFLLIAINLILVSFTGLSLYLTNKKSQADAKEKNIHFNIDYCRSQLNYYYIPLYDKIEKLNYNFTRYFTVDPSPELSKLIGQQVEDLRKFTLQYASFNAAEINKKMTKSVVVNNAEMQSIKKFYDRCRDDTQGLKFTDLGPKIKEVTKDAITNPHNFNESTTFAPEYISNLNSYVIEVKEYVLVLVMTNVYHPDFEEWNDVKKEWYLALYDVLNKLKKEEIASSIQHINFKIKTEQSKLDYFS